MLSDIAITTVVRYSYYHFRFVDRQLGFPTSGCIWQHIHLLKTDVLVTKLL